MNGYFPNPPPRDRKLDPLLHREPERELRDDDQKLPPDELRSRSFALTRREYELSRVVLLLQ